MGRGKEMKGKYLKPKPKRNFRSYVQTLIAKYLKPKPEWNFRSYVQTLIAEYKKPEPKPKLRSFLQILIFPLVMVYFESIFRIATAGSFFSWSTLYMVMFSMAYGVIGYLLTTIPRKIKTSHIITTVLLLLMAVPYLVEYFVYRQFKVYYDLVTVTGGAADAVGGFTDDIFRLLFSWDGFLKLFLYFLPAILWIMFGRWFFRRTRPHWKTRCVAAGSMTLLLCLSVLFINCSEMALSVYSKEYNFQSAVGNYGLITGVRLDIQNLTADESDAEFELGSTPTVPTTPTEPGETLPTAPIEYGYNQLELNLEGGNENIQKLNEYVKSQTATKQNKYTGMFKGKNLIFITAEAFTAEVIDPELTPTLYRMATKGIQFTDYYQPASAGTTGGEYQNIFGMIPTSGGASFKKTANTYNYMTLGSQLDRLGYYGKAYHNNSYKYYDRHKTHINLGYSDGYMGYGNGIEEFVQKAWPESDLQMFQGTLPTYIDKQPFNIYYMTVSGHSAYTRSGNRQTAKHWSRVEHLTYSDPVKGYLAANLELEDSMTYLIAELEKKGIADDTVICISTDHFPYGLDNDGKLGTLKYLSELYGYNVTNYMQRDHSRLILWCGSLEDQEPIVVDEPTFSLDILPTLSNLFGTEFDSRLFPGRDVFSEAPALVFNANYDWKTSLGTYISAKGKFIPVDENTEIPEGYVSSMKAIVRNKMKYCSLALNNDYYRYLFKK